MSEELIEHHIKYKELHGVDETIFLSRREHKKLHIMLRQKGKCNISVAELKKISNAAHERTEKTKEKRRVYQTTPKSKIYQREYWKSDQGKTIQVKYRNSELGCATNRTYRSEVFKFIDFDDMVGTNVRLRERLTINVLTGSVYYFSRFQGCNNLILPTVIEVKTMPGGYVLGT